MPNAITMLKAQHTQVKQLLRRLNETGGLKERERLVGEIEHQVKMHSQIEEEIFYPAFKAAAKKSDKVDMFYEATEEHHVVDIELPSLKTANPKSPEFKAKAKVLKELIEHHIREEEGNMFTAARQMFDEDELRELGDMMQARMEAIEAMWENPLLRPVKKMQSMVHKIMPTKVKNVKADIAAKLMERREAR